MATATTRIAAWISSLALGCALALAAPAARAADPLLMFVLGFAKNLLESAIEANAAKPGAAVAPAPLAAPLPPSKPPASMDENDLRALVDESFSYLTSAQRAELLAGLQKALSDPANAPHREAILAQFVGVARQVSFTQRQLDRLSSEDKRALAERFAANYRSLSAEQQQALSQQLQARALPLPADLNEMMLSALATTP